MTKGYATLSALLAAIMGVSVSAQDAGGLVTPYNVVWESPSKDASGQMPLGNGDIAAGVYAIENDALDLLAKEIGDAAAPRGATCCIA